MAKYSFGTRSRQRLTGVHPYLVLICNKALDYAVTDIMVVEGVRTDEQQQEYFRTGRSKTLNSKHLLQDDGYGHAVDLYPYPINMQKVNTHSAQEIARFGILQGVMQAALKELHRSGDIPEDVYLRWGGDWDGDGLTLDHAFFDAPHFELRGL